MPPITVIFVSLEESMVRLVARRLLGAVLALCLVSAAAVPASASVCFTSGKVYVQQKVWDKAAMHLECARKLEPDNIQVYLLLGSARAELQQYASAGAAFAIGLQAATKKKDDKKVADLQNPKMFYMSRLYNNGVKAMSLVGNVPAEGEASAGGTLPPFTGAVAPEVAITDSTVYGKYEGTSHLEEAAYYFRLATMVDPGSVDSYRNLSYVYDLMGRSDDAMAAARAGLALAPNDEKLARNLRAAAVGQANRLFQAGKFSEAIPAYRAAIENDPSSKLLYIDRIASAYYQKAAALDEKSPERPAILDSAAVAYKELLKEAPKDSVAIRQTAYYNIAVIYTNQSKYKDASEALHEAVEEFPKSKDLLSLAGQTAFNAGDFAGAVTYLKQAVAVDPKDPINHQFLFLSLNKLNKQNESVGEYSIYKALSEGKPRLGTDLKKWVDAADNRLGPGHQLKKTLTADGYPEEVRIFRDGEKSLESWFYWSKGKVITFMDGQVLSQATFPPTKS
jgi:tetratricopeptide (TPR) repeat protein